MVWCALEGEPDMSKSILQALVPADSPGLHTDGKWDTLGMRATFSPTVELRDVRVSSDATLGEPGAALRVGVVEGFALGYAAVYTALAEAALAFAMEAVKKRVVKPENIPVSHDPAVQRHIGELEARLHAVLLVLGDAAARWDKADMAARGLLANRAKLLATEVGLAVTAHAIQTVGGRAAYKEFPIERAFRDMRTATLMPPTMDRMMEAIGKAALGLEATMFRVGGSPSA
jgi:alkylation response protein AidB-like acyl-CoA dehydrogenase